MKFLFDDESFSFETLSAAGLTIAEGAGEHTHAAAVARAHQVMFDWLDTKMGAPAGRAAGEAS